MKDYKVIEVGCKAYEPFTGKPGWIDYSNQVSLLEALKIKHDATDWRKRQKVTDISYHIYKSTEDFNQFLKKVRGEA